MYLDSLGKIRLRISYFNFTNTGISISCFVEFSEVTMMWKKKSKIAYLVYNLVLLFL